jgi:SAM-dependent methyltransferase
LNQSHIEFLSSPEWAGMLETDLLPWIEDAGDLGEDVLEVGPGPGLTTDLLRQRVARLTVVEADPALAAPLRDRLAHTGVHVICGDAADSGLESDRFSAVTCFSVLHHVPSPEHQDRIFAEVGRVLRPGGVFVGCDSRDLDFIRDGHEGDTFVPVDPDAFPTRLAAFGLDDTRVDVGDYQFRFHSRKPSRSTAA